MNVKITIYMSKGDAPKSLRPCFSLDTNSVTILLDFSLFSPSPFSSLIFLFLLFLLSLPLVPFLFFSSFF